MDKQTVLIVDDTPQNIDILKETLKEDYKVVAATNGPRALQMAARDPLPDLVLLDVMMPEMDGFEVCERLKSDPRTERLPVIFVTALHETSYEERGLELGALDFITKPFHPALVKARVRNQLELKRYRDHLEDEVERRTAELLASNQARQKLENELDVARQLQRGMLPSDRLELAGGGSLAAFLRPARAVGGDLFDYARLGPRRLVMALGDVSDKGVPAALFMVRALTVLRSLAPSVDDPGELLARVNEALCQENDSFMFVTLVCGSLDFETSTWTWSSGGHEPPLLLDAAGARYLDLESGPALGLCEGATFPVHRQELAPGALVLLYTDGVTEAEDAAQTCFGAERLQGAVSAGGSRPAELLVRVEAAVHDFVGSHEQSDDLAMLAFQVPA